MMSTLPRAQKTVPHHPLPWIVITTTGNRKMVTTTARKGFHPMTLGRSIPLLKHGCQRNLSRAMTENPFEVTAQGTTMATVFFKLCSVAVILKGSYLKCLTRYNRR